MPAVSFGSGPEQINHLWRDIITYAKVRLQGLNFELNLWLTVIVTPVNSDGENQTPPLKIYGGTESEAEKVLRSLNIILVS